MLESMNGNYVYNAIFMIIFFSILDVLNEYYYERQYTST